MATVSSKEHHRNITLHIKEVMALYGPGTVERLADDLAGYFAMQEGAVIMGKYVDQYSSDMKFGQREIAIIEGMTDSGMPFDEDEALGGPREMGTSTEAEHGAVKIRVLLTMGGEGKFAKCNIGDRVLYFCKGGRETSGGEKIFWATELIRLKEQPYPPWSAVKYRGTRVAIPGVHRIEPAPAQADAPDAEEENPPPPAATPTGGPAKNPLRASEADGVRGASGRRGR